MPGWLESFLVSLFLAIGEKLVAKGKLELKHWITVRDAVKKAEKYEQVINNPDSSLEDRLRAEDELAR